MNALPQRADTDEEINSPYPASVTKLPAIGETRELFNELLSHGYPIQKIKVRITKSGSYVALQLRDKGFICITPHFPYISPISFIEGKGYFYAGDKNQNTLHLYVIIMDMFGVTAEKLIEKPFALDEMLFARYIESGIMEYTTPQNKTPTTEINDGRARFVDLQSHKDYELNEFSFEGGAISGKTIFRRDGTVYVIGRKTDNTRCVLVLPEHGGKPLVLGDKFLGDITPMMGSDGEIAGFEGPVIEMDGTIRKYQILCGEDTWSLQDRTLHVVK